MRALGYYRADASRNGRVSQQEFDRFFAEYCELNLHQPIRTFGDAAVSESGEYAGYHRMLDYIRESRSSFLVVVGDASHLGGDLEAVARSLVGLEETGTRVLCTDKGFPEPLQNAFKTLGVKGVSQTRSERIKESMRARALRGQGLGKPPFGYRIGADGTLEVVRQEASVVELIYRLYTKDGLGLRLIAQHLNERDIPTRRGGRWNVVTIRDILRNPTYMGTYTRFGLRLPKAHEAIIEPLAFRTAQDQTRARRPMGRVVNAEPFLLSGLVDCGYCGNKMMGVTRRQTWRRKDGRRARGVYRYYQCQSRNNQSLCGYHTWRAPLLEGTVLSQLRYALQAKIPDPDTDAYVEQKREAMRAAWRNRTQNAERRLVKAMRRAAIGETRVATLSRYLEELDSIRSGAKRAEQPTDATAVLASWDSLGFSERQGFFQEHITRIVAKDDTVEVII